MRRFAVLFGAVLAGLAASACCILPAIIGVTSAGALGLGTKLDPYRPMFMTMSLVMLGGGFYLSYRPHQNTECEESCCSTNANKTRVNRAILWISLVLAIYAMAYPALLSRASKASEKSSAGILPATYNVVKWRIKNMTCRACTVTLTRSLRGMRGVYSVTTDFTHKTVTVDYNGKELARPEIRNTIVAAGFHIANGK